MLQCGPNYKKIKFEWRNNSISHLYPPPYSACLGGCDTTFLELLQINLSTVRAVANTTQNTTNTRQNTNTSRQNTNNSGQTTNISRQNTNISGQTTNSNDNWQINAMETNTVTAMPRPAQRSTQFLPSSTVNRVPNTRMPTPRSSGDGNDNNVLCVCNKPAILLTVRKQTANFGEYFLYSN